MVLNRKGDNRNRNMEGRYMGLLLGKQASNSIYIFTPPAVFMQVSETPSLSSRPTLSLTSNVNPSIIPHHSTSPRKTKMTENGPADVPTGSTSDPSGFLSEIIGSPITVKLNSGVEYRGEISTCCFVVGGIRGLWRKRKKGGGIIWR